MENMKKIILMISITIFVFLTAVFSVSCTRSAPEITFGFIKLVLYDGGESGPQENFSFFILPNDEDGMENLDELYLYHDREQLRWQIKSDEWLRSTHDGKEWIGTRAITVTEGSLPRGVFRAVLVSKGGESSQRIFTFDGNVRFPFPELEISDGFYTVNSGWPVNRLVCYDGSGNYSTTVTLTELSGNISQLRLPPAARTAALWAEDEANFCSAFTDVLPLN
jgi:hypothetical protein